MAIPKDALSQIQLLIFDLDGTLLDSAEDLALSVNAMRSMMGLGSLSHALISTYVGQGVMHLVRRALGDKVAQEDVERGLKLFLDYYRAHMLDHTVPYPGVRETLAELRGRTLAVLTNKPARFSRDLLAGLGMAHYFAFIYGGDSFSQKKPDPVGVVKLMREARVAPQQTMMIGDSDTDMLTGRNARVWTCGVTYGFGAHTLESAPPDMTIGDLRDLPLLLDGRRQATGGRRKIRNQKSEIR